MTKASGRGRGWRKGSSWESLAKSTQKRYQSAGIDKARYERGATRGDWDRFLSDQERMYGRDRSEVKEELAAYNKGQVIDAIMLQKEMQRLYESGQIEAARAMWQRRDESMPAWMFFYHGAFS